MYLCYNKKKDYVPILSHYNRARFLSVFGLKHSPVGHWFGGLIRSKSDSTLIMHSEWLVVNKTKLSYP